MINLKNAAIALVVLAVLLGTGIAVLRGVSPSAKAIPTAHVQHGRVQVTVYTVGELRGTRAMQLAVPPMGGQLQIIKLAQTGDAVKADDVVVEFDAAEQEFNLEQARFDLQLAEQDIVKADTQAAVQAADDEVALLHARYDVRRAELDVQSNELVSAIKAQQNVLVLEEAKQRLAQLEADVKIHRETSRASADGLREKRNKAQLAVRVAERNIDSLRIRAPFDGFITIRTNFMAFGGIGFPGVMPDYRVGDATFAGQPIADLIDASKIEVTAKLQEQDRANVSPGQAVEVAVDGLPDATLRGTVRTVSGVASRGIFDAGTRQFDIAFDVAGHPAVRPGVSAAIAISGQAFDNVLYIPRTAVFDVGGKPTVYVRAAGGFDAQEIRVRAWTDSVAVVENIDRAAEVALVNPNAPSGARPKSQAPAPQRASR
ncbi:MAG TPA: HlyD family efflux transporter periplasmic adaptor subunit [Vicinamibacterales bacterium]|jgi:multidrug efflux pump subunit AcrA (membrane-fusion protein)|nr:HlyD family efflux transporter periplasmic adaptor subunit [Vicinamibacterales bacterium]